MSIHVSMPCDAEPSSPRQKLPDRRMHHGLVVEWNNGDQPTKEILGGLGTTRDGKVREVFVDRSERLKEGSEILTLANDACLLASLLLQHGYSASQLLAKLMKVHDSDAEKRFRDRDTGIARPSIIAKLLAASVDLEREEGPWIAWMHGEGPMPEGEPPHD